MTRNLLLLMSILLLQACATTSPYQPVNSRGFGYSETPLDDLQYRIDFKGWDMNQGKAVNYAMLRAAEFTLEKGYDWFEVIDRKSDSTKSRMSSGAGFSIAHHRTIEQNCGITGCRSRMSDPHSGIGMGFDLGGKDLSEAEVLLEIKMGKGVKPDLNRVYSAAELVNNMRSVLELETQDKSRTQPDGSEIK